MDVFVGFISPFPWSWPPLSWAKCTGAQLSIAQNQTLFSLLGVSFGGNGQSTFALPDLQGRQIIGYGQHPGGSAYPFGNVGGHEMITLQPSQTPLAAHTHTATFTASGGAATDIKVSTNPVGTSATPDNGSFLAAQKSLNGAPLFVPATPAPTTTVSLGGVSGGGGSGTVTVNPNTATAAATPVPLMNPYLALNFCIALSGLYPSRN